MRPTVVTGFTNCSPESDSSTQFLHPAPKLSAALFPDVYESKSSLPSSLRSLRSIFEPVSALDPDLCRSLNSSHANFYSSPLPLYPASTFCSFQFSSYTSLTLPHNLQIRKVRALSHLIITIVMLIDSFDRKTCQAK